MNPRAGRIETKIVARVLLVHNNPKSRRSWREAFRSTPDVAVVGETGDAYEALSALTETTPDVALVDLRLPKMSGIELTREIVRRQSKVGVVISSGCLGMSWLAEALQAGAKSYLPGDLPADLAEAVRSASRGQCYFTQETRLALTDMLLEDYVARLQRQTAADRCGALTGREREILRRLVNGKTNKEIACELELSVHTVDTHRARILQKLNVHSLAGLTAYVLLGEGHPSPVSLDGEA